MLKRGDIVRVQVDPEGGWKLAQIPSVEAALVALNTEDGAVLSMVGGFSFLAGWVLMFIGAIRLKRTGVVHE